VSKFYIAENKLHGRLPSDLGKSLPSIQQLAIGINLFTGALPRSLNNLSRLQVLDVDSNNFTGVVPTELGRLQNLEVLMLDNNKFHANNEREWGFITSLTNCSRLSKLTIGLNRFGGNLPSSLANFSTNLQWLRMTNNRISGAIPLDIGNLAGLEMLDLTTNLLSGAIPESIGKLTQLKELYIYLNNFSGVIPSSIGNLTGLSVLSAFGNNLEGSIPASIGNLSKLSAFSLSSNKLTGFIPYAIMELSSISTALDLSYNLLEGPLPLEDGNLVNLGVLILSGNKLSGKIPNAIGSCRVMEILLMDDNAFQGSIPDTFKNMAGLTVLNLTNNKLNGSIPGNLGSLTNLQELYLAHNNLSGSIPELLGNLTSLFHLDLSFNNLQGDVPEAGVFRNLTGLSIVGNKALCGGIPQLHLPRCQNSTARRNKKSVTKSLIIAIPTAGSLLLLLFLVYAGFLYRKFKTTPKKEIPPQFTETELPIVPYNEILKGTDGFSEANVLGKGRYGTVYRGTLENQAIAVAVKVFNVQQSGSYKSFQAECEALRRVRHRCLVKIITCCSSISHQGQDFRALVFEFMANGSLERWIHSNAVGQNQKALSLLQRLDIAVDIVDALDYLHNGCQPPVIHCDLKPSNILLNQDMRARVGDFGIARVLDESTSKHPVNSYSSIGIRGSIGYIAPGNSNMLPMCFTRYHIISSRRMKHLFTTNCFCLLQNTEMGLPYQPMVMCTVLESQSSRCLQEEVRQMFRDGMSLHYFAESALPDKVMEIADSNIWLHDGASNRNNDQCITRTKECLSSVIQLGVLCSKQFPIERMSMKDAAAEMHAIRDAYISTQQ
jgi:Leucine-rich repeat (LRR) protein